MVDVQGNQVSPEAPDNRNMFAMSFRSNVNVVLSNAVEKIGDAGIVDALYAN
jgi:hypothetical protein